MHCRVRRQIVYVGCLRSACIKRVDKTVAYGRPGSSPSTARFFLRRASSMSASHWFSPSMTERSERIFSKSRTHSSSSRVFNCFHTPSSADGQYFAGVGKQAEKFAYELAFNDEDMAPANTCCSLDARGPGAAATGACGGGEGEVEVR